MGVDVVLKQVKQPGTSPRRRQLTQVDAVLDGSDGFARLVAGSELPMLGRVDPYGTLILTSAEMDQFISEIGLLGRRALGASEQALLADVDRLARRCLADRSLELHLEGD